MIEPDDIPRCDWCGSPTDADPRAVTIDDGSDERRIRCAYCTVSRAPEPWVQVSASQISALLNTLEARLLERIEKLTERETQPE